MCEKGEREFCGACRVANSENRRRRAHIRARVNAVEKALLLERKRAVGARTWREYMFGVKPPRGGAAVDLSKIAGLSAAVTALQYAPRSLRKARKDVLGAVGELTRLSILNPERAELHRRTIEVTLREVRAAIAHLDAEIDRSELAAAPARDEIARVLRLVTGR